MVVGSVILVTDTQNLEVAAWTQVCLGWGQVTSWGEYSPPLRPVCWRSGLNEAEGSDFNFRKRRHCSGEFSSHRVTSSTAKKW